MVGSRFCEIAADHFDLVKSDINSDIKVDITTPETVEEFFKKSRFETVILFSAFTDVDAAESQRGNENGICWKINVEGASNVSDASSRYKKKLILISTDFVFDGESGPYSEEDEPAKNPNMVSWYGLTKLESERSAAKAPGSIILRIAYPYRAKFAAKDDMIKRILKAYKENSLYPMFSDQQITPTFIDDVAPVVNILVEKDLSGIFHLASPELASPYQIAKETIKIFGGDESIVKEGSLVDFLKGEGKTPRPLKGGLKVDKLIAQGYTPTGWEQGIKKIFEQSEGELLE